MELYGYLTEHAVSDHAFLAITGGGGKTTLMCNFAQYLKSQGKRVLVTTTTKVRSPYVHPYGQDMVFCDDSILDFRPNCGQIVFYAIGSKEDAKWTCPPMVNLEALKDRFDVVLCEADGSRMLPVKVHTQRDPVVPACTTHTIAVMGLWAIGKPVSEAVFGDDRALVVDRNYLSWLVHDSEGLLKASLPGHRTLVFNGGDENDASMVLGIKYPSDVTVLTAALDKGVLYDKIQ